MSGIWRSIPREGADMIVYENRNLIGSEDASQAFAEFLSSSPDTTTIDRVSYLFGMQAFCRRQFKQELTAAMNALGNGVEQPCEENATALLDAGLPIPH